MTQISNYINKVRSYCDFYLEFDSTNKRYKFNQQFVDEINCELFESEVEQLIDELYNILDGIKNQEKFVLDIISLLDNNISWYKSEKIFDFNSFHKLSSNLIKDDSILINNYTPSITKTEGNKIEKSKYIPLTYFLDCPEKLEDTKNELFYYIITHKSKTNNYKDELDFEKVKLHYVLTKYFESMRYFKLQLDSLCEKIIAYDIEDFGSIRPIKKPKPRCVVNLVKVEVATLFDAFFKSGIFYFDLESDKKREKAKYDFINNNFSYYDRKNKIVEISNINKEFDYIKSTTFKDRQNEIIDKLVDTLKEIKTKL